MNLLNYSLKKLCLNSISLPPTRHEMTKRYYQTELHHFADQTFLIVVWLHRISNPFFPPQHLPLWERWTRRPDRPDHPCSVSPHAAEAGRWSCVSWGWPTKGRCREGPSDTSCLLHKVNSTSLPCLVQWNLSINILSIKTPLSLKTCPPKPCFPMVTTNYPLCKDSFKI